MRSRSGSAASVHANSRRSPARIICGKPLLRLALERETVTAGPATPGGGIAYPYFFMDADRLGYGAAVANMAAIALGFVLTGLAVVWLDRRLAPSGLQQGPVPA